MIRRDLGGAGDEFAFDVMTSTDPEAAARKRLHRRRARAASWFDRWADYAPVERRRWFRLSKIADELAREPSGVTIDATTRASAVEKLRQAINAGSLRVLSLLPAPFDDTWLPAGCAQRPDTFPPLVDSGRLWVKRTDIAAWFRREAIKPPQALHLPPPAAVDPSAGSDTRKLLEREPAGRETARVWRALLAMYPDRQIPEHISAQSLADKISKASRVTSRDAVERAIGRRK